MFSLLSKNKKETIVIKTKNHCRSYYKFDFKDNDEKNKFNEIMEGALILGC